MGAALVRGYTRRGWRLRPLSFRGRARGWAWVRLCFPPRLLYHSRSPRQDRLCPDQRGSSL